MCGCLCLGAEGGNVDFANWLVTALDNIWSGGCGLWGLVARGLSLRSKLCYVDLCGFVCGIDLLQLRTSDFWGIGTPAICVCVLVRGGCCSRSTKRIEGCTPASDLGGSEDGFLSSDGWGFIGRGDGRGTRIVCTRSFRDFLYDAFGGEIGIGSGGDLDVISLALVSTHVRRDDLGKSTWRSLETRPRWDPK